VSPRDKAIALARKLLAQAEDPGATPEESQAFAAKAAEIMLRHDLTDAVVRATADQTKTSSEPIDVFTYRISGEGGHGRHRAWALGDVAAAYGGEVCFFGNNASNQTRTLHIVGTAADLDTLRLLLPTVAAVAETSAAAAARRHRTQLAADGWYTKTELDREVTWYRRSFLRGFGAGVAEQIRTRRAGLLDEIQTAGSGAELVLADRASRVAAEFRRRYPKLGRPRPVRGHSTAGRRDGHAAGRAFNFGGNQLDTGRPHPELPR